MVQTFRTFWVQIWMIIRVGDGGSHLRPLIHNSLSSRREAETSVMCASNEDNLDPITACSHDRWLPLFRSHSLRSIIVPLPDGFVEYLSEDGIFLGAASDAVRRHDFVPCIMCASFFDLI